MDSWIIWIVGCSVAYTIGHFIGGHMKAFQMMQKMVNDPEGMIDLIKHLKTINDTETDVAIPDDAHLLELEEVNGQVYAYDKLTGEFLAQGPNKYMAALAAASRFPGKKFWHPDFKQDSQTA
jgi:hypothetical protein